MPEIAGTIEKTFFSGATFTAGKIRVGRQTHSFTAPQALAEDARVKLIGDWTDHPKYGRQFTAENVELSLDMDAAGLMRWIAKHPDLKGIGPIKAARIADYCGDDFDRVITEDPLRLAKAAKLNQEQIDSLVRVWEANRKETKVISWLGKFGLTFKEIETLRGKYGEKIVGLLKTDPYLIIKEIPRFGFKKVDIIAQKIGIPKTHESRIRHGIMWTLRQEADQGNTWMSDQKLRFTTNETLELDCDPQDADNLIEQQIEHLNAMGLIRGPIENADKKSHWSIHYLHDAEKNLLRFFTENRNHPHWEESDYEDLDSTVDALGTTLNEKQKKAVKNAIRHPISIITGGAGTGKTYTLEVIKRLFQGFDMEVGLAAPTGKAARRMAESTYHDAFTIHKLLDFSPVEGFRYNADNPLEYDLVIIDEFSMVDVELAYHLFSAIDITRTSIIIVGDHHQLPPVGPGNILRDLIQHEVVPVTLLDTVVRQAGVLKLYSQAILDGKVHPTADPDDDGDVPWIVKDKFRDPRKCRNYVVKGFKSLLEKQDVDIYHDIQILAPMKERDLGTKTLNQDIQQLVQGMLYGVDTSGTKNKLFINDKVICTKNDYDTGIMNGTIGRICDIDSDGSMLIAFDGAGEPAEFEPEKRKILDLAYALTIHKSQGSEFSFVVLIIHKSQSYMHHRNLFYTGATRASEKLLIVGDAWAIRNCAKREIVKKRRTNLDLWLKLQEKISRAVSQNHPDNWADMEATA